MVSAADLRGRWKVTKQRVDQVTGAEDFPAPTSPGYGALWLAVDVEDWRRRDAQRPGRRGPKPRALEAVTEHNATTAAAARKAWSALQRAGGIVTVADLATTWGISDRAVRLRTEHATFPQPIATGRWLGAEVAAWHRGRNPKLKHD